MIQLFMLKLHLGGCTSPTTTPKFELRLSEGGSTYKSWDLVYKIVQNENKIMIQFFILKLHFGGLHFTSPPRIWIAYSTRRNGVQNLELGVQNCTKLWSSFLCWNYIWGAACHQPPKFEFPIAQEGMVYQIWDSVYKIIQHEYKIMIRFFMLKLHLGGLHVTSPPNLNCR